MEVKKDIIESLSDLKTGELKKNDVVVGPKPLPKPQGHISYGGALGAGEGDAIIAQYVEQGKRSRGEVGVSGDEISGHWRMNGVGIRKENQVCSGEDTRGLAMFNYEEKARRKEKIMAHLQHLVQLQIGKAKGPSPRDPFADGDGREACRRCT